MLGSRLRLRGRRGQSCRCVRLGAGGDTKNHVLNAMIRNTESAERWKNMVYGYTGWMSQKSSTKGQMQNADITFIEHSLRADVCAHAA